MRVPKRDNAGPLADLMLTPHTTKMIIQPHSFVQYDIGKLDKSIYVSKFIHKSQIYKFIINMHFPIRTCQPGNGSAFASEYWKNK